MARLKVKPNEVDIGRLCEAIHKARYTLRKFREERLEIVRQYVGNHWSEEGAKEKVPVNLVRLYCQIVGRKLIAENPRLMLSTWKPEDKPAVDAMESWANREIENMRLDKTLQRAVLDGLFSVGVIKVALATPADAGHTAWNLQAGTPFAQVVDLDDFVFDIHARDFEHVGFIGHRYRPRLDDIKNSSLYGKDRKDLSADPDLQYNVEGDLRISVLGRAFWSSQEEDEGYVNLWEIYIPHKRLVVTLHEDQIGSLGGSGPTTEALRQVEWLGPDSGPYHVLGFDDVPGNAMPAAPLQGLLDLHLPVNHIYRKLIRQAERQKEVLPVRDGGSEDGDRLVKTNDGEAFRCDGEAPRPVAYGGPNQQNFALGQALAQEFSRHAGNLDIAGGLAPQSKTAAQDTMLNQNASSVLAAMQARAVSFTTEVARALCWYWWNHPTQVMETTWHPHGLPEFAIQRKVHPALHRDPKALRRTGRLADMEVKVYPYSMQGATPESRVQALNQVVQNIIAPMLQLLTAQGAHFDINMYLKKVAKYMDMPDLPEIIQFAEPPVSDSAPGTGLDQGGAPKPPSTTRNYVRRSEGNDTQDNNRETLNQMMQGSIQPGERNGTVNR